MIQAITTFGLFEVTFSEACVYMLLWTIVWRLVWRRGISLTLSFEWSVNHRNQETAVSVGNLITEWNWLALPYARVAIRGLDRAEFYDMCYRIRLVYFKCLFLKNDWNSIHFIDDGKRDCNATKLSLLRRRRRRRDYLGSTGISISIGRFVAGYY